MIVGDTIKNVAQSNRIYLSDSDDTAPASPLAAGFLWIMLAVAAFVAIFMAQ